MCLKKTLLSILFFSLSLVMQAQISNDSIKASPLKDSIPIQDPPKYTKTQLDSIIQSKLSIEPKTKKREEVRNASNIISVHSPTRATL